MGARNQYYKHFASRLAERYGLIATDRLYNDIIRQIQNRNKLTKIKAINNQRSIHQVWVNGKPVYVVYRKKMGKQSALITALHPAQFPKTPHLTRISSRITTTAVNQPTTAGGGGS